MNQREIKQLARSVVAQVIEREMTHNELLLSLAESEGLTDKEADKLRDCFLVIISQFTPHEKRITE